MEDTPERKNQQHNNNNNKKKGRGNIAWLLFTHGMSLFRNVGSQDEKGE
jgi:hypothetical protein